MADKEIEIKVTEDGSDDTLSKIRNESERSGGRDRGRDRGRGGGGGGSTVGAAGFGAVLKVLTGISMKILGVVGVLLGILALLLSFEPVTQMLSAITDVLQTFLLPLAQMLLTLFEPVLRALVQLLPHWLDFWSDPVGHLITALSFLGAVFTNVVGWLMNGLRSIWDILKGLPRRIWEFMKQLPKRIWEFMKQLPERIGNILADAVPGLDTARDIGGGIRDRISGGSDNGGSSGSRLLDVNVRGYNDEEIKSVLAKAFRRG